MKTYLILIVSACLFMASTSQKTHVNTDDDPVKAWYLIKAGEKSFTVQTLALQTKWVHSKEGKVTSWVIYNGNEIQVANPIEITPHGTAEEPTPYSDSSCKGCLVGFTDKGVPIYKFPPLIIYYDPGDTKVKSGKKEGSTEETSTETSQGTETTTTTTTSEEGSTTTTSTNNENEEDD